MLSSVTSQTIDAHSLQEERQFNNTGLAEDVYSCALDVGDEHVWALLEASFVASPACGTQLESQLLIGQGIPRGSAISTRCAYSFYGILCWAVITNAPQPPTILLIAADTVELRSHGNDVWDVPV